LAQIAYAFAVQFEAYPDWSSTANTVTLFGTVDGLFDPRHVCIPERAHHGAAMLGVASSLCGDPGSGKR
jgi:hypothetical protein